jgi:hypothetical protein
MQTRDKSLKSHDDEYPSSRQEMNKLPIFRIDYYVQASLDKEVRLGEDSKTLLEALSRIPVLKNVKMSEAESGDNTWFEFEGSIDIPEGSKAFLAMIKQVDPEDPYNVFLRIDINKESDTRENAERETRNWIENIFAIPLRRAMGFTKIKIGTPLEIIMDKKAARNAGGKTHSK